MSRFAALVFIALFIFCPKARADWKLTDMRGKDADGNLIIVPKPMEARFKNPISAADERAFQQRARAILDAQSQLKVAAGNTYFENEKRTYGYLMAQILAGREQASRTARLQSFRNRCWSPKSIVSKLADGIVQYKAADRDKKWL